MTNKGKYVQPPENLVYIKRTLENKDDIWEENLVAEEPKSNPHKNYMPNFRSITTVFPHTPAMNNGAYPLGILVSPGDFHRVPLLNCSTQYIPKCFSCGAYPNICCRKVPDKNSVICPICGSEITLPKDMDVQKHQFFTSPVYDVILQESTEHPLSLIHI